MSARDNGGSAFPHSVPVGAWGDPSQGMTLRDYFAAKAMIALAGSEKWINGMDRYAAKTGVEFKDALALESYKMADAMLAARGAA